MERFRLTILAESRIRWKVYVRFGGEYWETYHRNMTRRRVLSLHYIMDAVQTAIKDKIIVVQGRQVILDSDVAALYGVETKRVNEAIKNNPDKFPDGYILQLTPSEWEDLRSKISTTKSAKVRYAPKAFTEKGLYMLATILKSPVATQTTIGIIETFAKVKELSRTMSALQEPNDPHLQERLAEKGSRIISDLLDDAFETTQSETTIECNLVVLKVKHTITRKPK